MIKKSTIIKFFLILKFLFNYYLFILKRKRNDSNFMYSENLEEAASAATKKYSKKKKYLSLNKANLESLLNTNSLDSQAEDEENSISEVAIDRNLYKKISNQKKVKKANNEFKVNNQKVEYKGIVNSNDIEDSEVTNSYEEEKEKSFTPLEQEYDDFDPLEYLGVYNNDNRKLDDELRNSSENESDFEKRFFELENENPDNAMNVNINNSRFINPLNRSHQVNHFNFNPRMSNREKINLSGNEVKALDKSDSDTSSVEIPKNINVRNSTKDCVNNYNITRKIRKRKVSKLKLTKQGEIKNNQTNNNKNSSIENIQRLNNDYVSFDDFDNTRKLNLNNNFEDSVFNLSLINPAQSYSDPPLNITKNIEKNCNANKINANNYRKLIIKSKKLISLGKRALSKRAAKIVNICGNLAVSPSFVLNKKINNNNHLLSEEYKTFERIEFFKQIRNSNSNSNLENNNNQVNSSTNNMNMNKDNFSFKCDSRKVSNDEAINLSNNVSNNINNNYNNTNNSNMTNKILNFSEIGSKLKSNLSSSFNPNNSNNSTNNNHNFINNTNNLNSLKNLSNLNSHINQNSNNKNSFSFANSVMNPSNNIIPSSVGGKKLIDTDRPLVGYSNQLLKSSNGIRSDLQNNKETTDVHILDKQFSFKNISMDFDVNNNQSNANKQDEKNLNLKGNLNDSVIGATNNLETLENKNMLDGVVAKISSLNSFKEISSKNKITLNQVIQTGHENTKKFIEGEKASLTNNSTKTSLNNITPLNNIMKIKNVNSNNTPKKGKRIPFVRLTPERIIKERGNISKSSILLSKNVTMFDNSSSPSKMKAPEKSSEKSENNRYIDKISESYKNNESETKENTNNTGNLLIIDHKSSRNKGADYENFKMEIITPEKVKEKKSEKFNSVTSNFIKY